MLAESEKLKVLERMRQYCAYRDRCHKEVRIKLIQIKVYGDDLEDILTTLVQEDFLNEERFARSFARGKFRLKQWGRIRITNELKQRDISDYCLRKALTEIDEEEYQETAAKLAKKLLLEYNGHSDFERRQKVTQRMARKGFEFDIIQRTLSN